MGLRFSASTDKVTVAAASSINSLATATIAAWVYPTTLTSLMRVFQKGTNPNQKLFCLNGTGGNIEADFGRGTGGAGNVGIYISNSLPLVTLNKWYFVCATYDSGGGAGNIMHIYVGDRAAPPTEVTYGTKTDGTGTTPSDTSADMAIGNAVAGNATWQGEIESALFWNRVLTLPEVIAQWRKRGNSPGLMIHQELGVPNQGIQADLSGNGNHGVVTGAALRERAIPRVGQRRRLLVSVASGTTDTVGSSSGTGTATGVGASTAASTGVSDGVGAASGVGASTTASTGDASGVGAATGVGSSIAAAVGASNGTSTASAVSSGDIATGTAAGTSTCAAVGTGIVSAVGSASGTASAAGIGAGIAISVGSAAAVSTCVGVGASTWMAAGSAAGICTVTGVGSQLGAVPWGVPRQNSMCGVTDQNSDCGVTRNNTYQQRRTPTQS